MLLPFLTAAKNELLKQMDSVAAQYQVLGADQKIVQGLVDELNRKTAALEDLQEKGADWRSGLSLFFSVLQNDANKDQQQIGTNARGLVQDRSRLLGERICKEKNYTQLLYDVNDLISQGIVDIREDIARKVENKSAELQRELDFSVSVNEDILGGLGFTPEDNLSVVFPPKKEVDTAIKWGRTIGINSMGGGTIGSILGGFIGLCFGGPVGLYVGAQIGGGVGGLAGGAKGCVDALTQHDQLDVNTVIQALNQHIATSMTNISANTSNTIAALRIAMTSSFEQQLKKQAKGLKENASKIQRNINVTTSELPKKRTALEGQSVQLKKELARYEALEKAIDELGGKDRIQANRDGTDAAADEISYGFL